MNIKNKINYHLSFQNAHYLMVKDRNSLREGPLGNSY